MKKLLKNLFKNSLQKGFTLIELLVVIAVLGVLATIVLLAVNPGEQLARGRDTSRIAAVTQLGRAVQSYYTAAGGSLLGLDDAPDVGPAIDWMNPLIVSNDLKVRPGNPNWGTVPPAIDNCLTAYANTLPTPLPNAGQYCYRVDLTTSAHNAVVYARLESNLYNNKCTVPGEVAFGVFSTADARFGVACLASGATSTDAAPGNQTFTINP